MPKSYLVEVSVIAKNSGTEALSYFSSTKVTPGTIVRVPVRKAYAPAIVLSIQTATSAKSNIRKAGFVLRKIRKSDISTAILPKEFISAIEESAEFYGTSIGAILSQVLPKIILDNPQKFLIPESSRKPKVEKSRETALLQMESEERFGQYRAHVRQSFARRESVIFVIPTHTDALKAKRELSRGIEEFVYLWTIEKKPEAKKIWDKALRDPHPILFITTPAGLTLPRKDLGTIIVERENSRAWRTMEKPYINWKLFIEALASRSGKQLLLGDSVLSIETLWKEKRGEYGEASLIRWRLPGAPTRLIDMASPASKNSEFQIISPELKALIEQALGEDERIMLFGARKGLSPTTVCGDCGMILACLNCGAPVVLHKRANSTIYVCHACKSTRDSSTTCDYCDSWKLVPLGIGTEQIAKAVKDLFPHKNIFILDKDHAPNALSARRILETFLHQGSILIGTELAFFHLDEVAYSALVSADALFSIPDFSINERIFYLVSHLREMTQKGMIVQTRNIGKEVLGWASSGNIIDFYSSEISERESLLYPPFSVFIKIEGGKFKIEDLKEQFAKWSPDVYENSLIMRILRDRWPDEELSKKLSLLPPQFLVKVDPESIL